MRNHRLTTDILVVGGGPTGLAAALSAARNGARVILCQDRPVLGGNSSSEVRMHMVGADGTGHRSRELELEARESGIIEELRLEACVRNPQRSASMLDLIAYDACRREGNLTLLLNTTVTGAEMENGRIRAALAVRHSTEDSFTISAKTFIDCSGDGRLSLEAGARFVAGREGKNAYGESLAQEEPDGKTLGSTLLFLARRHDQPMPFVPPPWARKFSEHDLRLRPHASKDADGGLEYGYWWVEWGGQFDTVADNEQIRDELLAIVFGVWDHVKNHADHGADNWALDWFGFLPGKRESRRFFGQHRLTEGDLFSGKRFPDAIAFGGWPIDTHPPEGVDAPDEPPCEHTNLPHLYDIPLRCCISADVPNLMLAGRLFSATHIAFASTRVMATCAAMGQGVGTAAAIALRAGVEPDHIADDPALISRIQQQLLRDDAFLIGIRNEDTEDLARCARVTASSEQAEGPALNVLSGATRAMSGEASVPAERQFSGTQRWMSQPTEGLPAELALVWEQPCNVSEIQLTFDTGLHRLLFHTHSDLYTRRMVWGVPQPETVRDYDLLGFLGAAPVFRRVIKGNYQRLNRTVLEAPVRLDRLVVRVNTTNGLDHARIFEVRVYGSGQA